MLQIKLTCKKVRVQLDNVNVESTVGELKQRVQEEGDSRLAPEAQRVLLKSKERKDSVQIKEVLTANDLKKLENGDDVSLKGMILLTERYTNVLDETTELDAEEQDEEDEAGADPEAHKANLTPLLDAGDLDEGAILLNVQQGKDLFQVVAPRDSWTILDVKLNLQSRVGVPVAQQRLLIKSKVRDNNSTLVECSVSSPGPVKAMLLFSAGYHIAQDGAAYLEIADEELQRCQELMRKIKSQLSHRVADAFELSLELSAAIDRLENVQSGLDRPVPQQQRDRKTKVLQGLAETIEKLQHIRKYGTRTEK